MTVHVAPHGRIGLPRWQPQRHPGAQGVFGAHRGLAGLLGFVLIAAVAVLVATVALAPGRPVAFVEPAGPTYDHYLNTNLIHEEALGLTALRKVFDPTEIQAIGTTRAQAPALAASRQDDRLLDSRVQALKSLSAFVWTQATLDPIALAASRNDDRTLDQSVQQIKSQGSATETPAWRYGGKPLPL